MIPNAETLAAILNDPAIPSEAKPEWARNGVTLKSGMLGDPLIWACCTGYLAKHANADLFWSMSAWLWERGDGITVNSGAVFMAAQNQPAKSFRIDGRGAAAYTAATPIEALAAVVREVAKSVD